MMGKVTIQTIAQKVGVSVGTVDRALNNRGRIKEETRCRILEMADQLGYQPNKLASALGRQHKFRIAVITPRHPEFFHQHIFRGLEAAIREVTDFGVTVDIISCESLKVEDELPVLKALDRSKYDGIVLNAGGDALSACIDDFVESGTPVVTFNSDAADSRRAFFVGENPEKSGRMAGYMMGRLMNGHGTVAVMTSFFHPGAAMNRRKGFLDALVEFPGISVVGNYAYDDYDEKAYSVVSEVMARYPDIGGIFSNSATGSEACARYALAHRGEYRPVLIGYDVSRVVEQCLAEGLFDMAIDQQADRQCYHAVMLMYRHLAERWTPATPQLEIQVNMVMRYNAQEHALERVRSESIIR